jgi:hypothetical protein
MYQRYGEELDSIEDELHANIHGKRSSSTLIRRRCSGIIGKEARRGSMRRRSNG